MSTHNRQPSHGRQKSHAVNDAPIMGSMVLAADKSQFEIASEDFENTVVQLLKSRLLIRRIIEQRMYLDRIKKGNLNAREICDLLKNQGEDEDEDFVMKITDLRRTLLNEIRKNAGLEKDISDIEKRITLLVQNAGAVMTKTKKKKRVIAVDATVKDSISSDKMSLYGNLFYLLQSDPVYLARLINVISQTDTDVHEIVDSIILTLYGNAMSDREDYLILTVIKLALEQQMSTLTNLWTAIQDQSVIPQMMVAYTKRKEGQTFLNEVFGPCMQRFAREFPTHRKLNLDGKKILDEIINESEQASGVKSSLRNVGADKILEQPEVKKIISERVSSLKEGCNIFYETIISSINKFPYGLRFLCQVINSNSMEAFPNTTESELLTYTGYFMFYRFVGNYIASSSNDTQSGFEAIQNILLINKILQQLFQQQSPFPVSDTNKWLVPMNDWINERVVAVKGFLKEFVEVEPPEQKMQIDKYMALIQDVKPTILIEPSEITMFHREICDHLNDLSANKEDPLHRIIDDLGDLEEYTSTDVVQLTLTPKYISQSLEDEDQQLYNKTKQLLLGAFKLIANTDISPTTVSEVLEEAEKLAKQKNNETVLKNIGEVKKNIVTLEKKEMISKEDGHRTLLKDVALEIANRSEIKEQQSKELTRLDMSIKATLKNKRIARSLNFIQRLLSTMCPETIQGKNKGKKSKKTAEGKLFKPKEFTYNELVKKVKMTKITISSEEIGVFNVQVKIPALASENADIKLEDLLEMRSKGTRSLDVNSQMELDVNMTIYVMNQLISK
ncbi:GTPase-activating protein [Entamoeba marina]